MRMGYLIVVSLRIVLKNPYLLYRQKITPVAVMVTNNVFFEAYRLGVFIYEVVTVDVLFDFSNFQTYFWQRRPPSSFVYFQIWNSYVSAVLILYQHYALIEFESTPYRNYGEDEFSLPCKYDKQSIITCVANLFEGIALIKFSVIADECTQMDRHLQKCCCVLHLSACFC